MIKKLLILPLLWGILWLGAFASANTVDWFTSDSEIVSLQSSDWWGETYQWELYDYYFSIDDLMGGASDNQWDESYFCFSSSQNWVKIVWYDDLTHFPYYSSSSNVVCWTFTITDYKAQSNYWGVLYASKTLITPPVVEDTNGWNDNSSSIVPSIPSSFTSWITVLVSNFGSILVGWLPTIILVALWITAIFVLFRVVRNYARSTFNW